MAHITRRFYEFGSFRLDPEKRRLFRNGEVVVLSGKGMEALLVLVRNRNRVMERETLTQALWPDSVVEDANLSVAISHLRKVLSEDGVGEYIETIPRLGYRFVADVREIHEEQPALVIEKYTVSESIVEEQIERDQSDAASVERLVLKGRYQWNKRHAAAVKLSIGYYEEAIEIDPTHAPAYAGLADSYMMLGFLGAVPPAHTYPKVKAASKRAMELDPKAAEPVAALGYVTAHYYYNPSEALQYFDEAIRLDPEYAWAHHWRGVTALVMLGRFDDALLSVTRAEELDPLSPIMSTAVGIVHHYARRYNDAIAVYQSVLATAPTFAPGHFYLGLSLEQSDRLDEAIDCFREAHRLGLLALALGALGHALGAAGRRQEALDVLIQLKTLSENQYISPYAAMMVHAGLGDQRETLARLREALAERTPWLLTTQNDARMDKIRESVEGRRLLEMNHLLF